MWNIILGISAIQKIWGKFSPYNVHVKHIMPYIEAIQNPETHPELGKMELNHTRGFQGCWAWIFAPFFLILDASQDFVWLKMFRWIRVWYKDRKQPLVKLLKCTYDECLYNIISWVVKSKPGRSQFQAEVLSMPQVLYTPVLLLEVFHYNVHILKSKRNENACESWYSQAKARLNPSPSLVL